MKKMLQMMLVPLLILTMLCAVCFPAAAQTEQSAEIVILHTNDVHCGVDAGSPEGTMGYANLAALKKELEAQTPYVALVDAGDAIQGEAIGTLSDGAYLVDIMNRVGYDYAAFGNHEFDYGMDQALALPEQAQAEYLACNFVDLRSGQTVAKPYRIAQYGDRTVAYVGIATPETFTKSRPVFFQDEQGNYIYSFCEAEEGQQLYRAVQKAIDDAKAEGADFVIALGHLGTDPASAPFRSTDVIANTTGLDAFLDGHSHSVLNGEKVLDADGKEVLLSSAGSKLESIGKLTIAADGTLSAELISGYTEIDPETDAFVKEIQARYEELLAEVVGRSEVSLVINDPVTGQRIIRSRETNLGDLCADAYRLVLGADVAMVNGGGIRAEILPGDITNENLIAVHPYGNMMCVAEVTGQEILDILEMGAKDAPQENGGFQHVSGMKYTIRTAIPSGVELDDKGMLVRINGQRRVTDVQILQKDGSYAPLDPERVYTLASHNYMLKDGGAGVPFLNASRLVQDEVMTDNHLLITYVRDYLKGVVGEQYAEPYGQGRITITDELPVVPEENPQTSEPVVPEENPQTSEPVTMAPVIAAVTVLLLCAVAYSERRKLQ